ncbi:CFI-box-CTERM domain-containing protein [Methyloceanibacter caenitepidi]|uniref:Uncharacterized protein n=1 Tax=Methyloceanibacter caenitepidi TaxID=1384459 RepID=A0A0A8K3C7_9HYPH|nr:CFI-box-CTERM domain-containing protein [Methyloceanibacter caenitepidi]BAQ16499.1 hypothetical protein GL4_1039 [Methyloceanibacter caenitepidi]
MSYRSNLQRLKAITALVTVAPFVAATIVPEQLNAQASPPGARSADQVPSASHKGARGKKNADAPKEQAGDDLQGEIGNWRFSSQGGYLARAYPRDGTLKVKSGGPKFSAVHGRANLEILYWSPPGDDHGYGGDLTVERAGSTSGGSFKAHVFVDGREVDSFAVANKTTRDLTKLFGSDLGGLTTARNLRVTADISGGTYDIFEFDLDGAGEVLEAMTIGPDRAWRLHPNPAARHPRPRNKTNPLKETAVDCANVLALSLNRPKQEDGTLGSWSYDFLGSAVHSDLIPEKIKTRNGGNLDGDNKKGGMAELRIWYNAQPGPKQGFSAWISVTPVGKYDSFEAELLLDGEKADTMTFAPEPGSTSKNKPYSKSFDLKKLYGGDLERVAGIRNVRIAATMDGNSFDVFDVDLEGTGELVQKMKTEADAYYAPYAARKACNSGSSTSSDNYMGSGPPRRQEKCFLTTACCDVVGLADDCFELTALRAFRDKVLKRTADGRREIRRYYDLAPKVLREMRQRGEERRLLGLYFSHILPCAIAARLGLVSLPRRHYHGMVRRLVSRYQPEHRARIT